ncbi:helix-turn-helix domain-containing protein, partial [Roseisolibacter sp. H3M3-2]|uniref:helix-turn-helix domain-containing protein n=1 Tax=Roseisolibacter sp. H3M3-2 TaxID=3031323 RepID=UPI0023DAC0F2
LRWLAAAAAARASLPVLALLGAPAGPALHQLVARPRRFACVDVVLGRETPARALAGGLEEALRHAGDGGVLPALESRWPLDPLLAALARAAYAAADGGAWPTTEALLRAAGIGRGTFVRHAAAAGFRPPLRFVQLLRVLGAASAIRGGATAVAAAARFGYGSPDTLRQHFAAVAGLTPRDARHLDAAALVARARDHAAVHGVPRRRPP